MLLFLNHVLCCYNRFKCDKRFEWTLIKLTGIPFLFTQLAIEKYNSDLSALTKTCEEMKKLYSVILVILQLLFQYLFLHSFRDGRPLRPGGVLDGPFTFTFVILSPLSTRGECLHFRGRSWRGYLFCDRCPWEPTQVYNAPRRQFIAMALFLKLLRLICSFDMLNLVLWLDK